MVFHHPGYQAKRSNDPGPTSARTAFTNLSLQKYQYYARNHARVFSEFVSGMTIRPKNV